MLVKNYHVLGITVYREIIARFIFISFAFDM